MTEIITKAEVEQKIYIANDGTKFDKKLDCEVYENKMNEAVRKAKWDKIMGKGTVCPTVMWTYGCEVEWYLVSIKTHDDLIDFLSLISKYEAYDFDTKFIDEVTIAINNGEEFKMVVDVNDENGYIGRYKINFPSTNKESYDNYIASFDEEIKLLEEMKKYVTYTEPKEA